MYVTCVYSMTQQFLYWKTPEFIFVPLIIAICYFILKYLLIRHFVFILFCEFQMSTHTTAILNLGDALITQEQEAKIMSLKIQVLLIILSIISGVTERLVSLMKYKIPRILRYNLDWEPWAHDIIYVNII